MAWGESAGRGGVEVVAWKLLVKFEEVSSEIFN
jgi:hypothetical protein